MEAAETISLQETTVSYKVTRLNLNFELAQPSRPFQKYEWKSRQKEDTLVKKETSKTCQLKVTKMGYEILHNKINY